MLFGNKLPMNIFVKLRMMNQNGKGENSVSRGFRRMVYFLHSILWKVWYDHHCALVARAPGLIPGSTRISEK
jgi:hypothetical protein